MSDPWQTGGYDRRTTLKLLAGVVVGLPLVAAGCGDDDETGGAASGGGEKRRRIAFGQPHREGDFYVALIAGARAEAKARNVELLESFASGEVEAQLNEINTWIAQGVDGLTVLALDPKAVSPLIKKAQAADIVWVSYAFNVPGSDAVTTFDDIQGGAIVGEEAGKWINDRLGGSAEVAMLGDDTVETPRIRLDEAKKKLAEVCPGAKLVARQKGLLAPDALKATQSLLQAHPDVKVVLCAADDGALGASQAIGQSDVKKDEMFVGGWDGSRAAMQKVLDGDVIRAVGALDLTAVGRSVVSVPLAVLEGKGKKQYSAPYVLVTPETRSEGERLIKAFDA
jgi:ribose transport system substrate-binding protein